MRTNARKGLWHENFKKKKPSSKIWTQMEGQHWMDLREIQWEVISCISLSIGTKMGFYENCTEICVSKKMEVNFV